jgi:hypothetical protein
LHWASSSAVVETYAFADFAASEKGDGRQASSVETLPYPLNEEQNRRRRTGRKSRRRFSFQDAGYPDPPALAEGSGRFDSREETATASKMPLSSV